MPIAHTAGTHERGSIEVFRQVEAAVEAPFAASDDASADVDRAADPGDRALDAAEPGVGPFEVARERLTTTAFFDHVLQVELVESIEPAKLFDQCGRLVDRPSMC